LILGIVAPVAHLKHSCRLTKDFKFLNNEHLIFVEAEPPLDLESGLLPALQEGSLLEQLLDLVEL